MTEPRTFTDDQMHTAMCIIEEMVDPLNRMPDAPVPWQDFRNNNGINALREFVIDELIDAADAAWEKVHAAYEAADRAAFSAGNKTPDDPGSFDYDFVPTWLRIAVDWSNVNAPRVLGKGGKASTTTVST